MKTNTIPPATVARLPVYFRSLQKMRSKNIYLISSYELAKISGGNAAQLRKDLSYLGEFGTRGVGYEVDHLINQIGKYLGATTKRSVAIIGMGRLGQALSNYKGFSEKGFEIKALFDADPKKVGRKFGKLNVEDISDLSQTIKRESIEIGIVATPAESAQKVVDTLTATGIKAILNFAPTTLKISDGVCLRNVDLSTELQIIGYHLQRVEQGLPSKCCTKLSAKKD